MECCRLPLPAQSRLGQLHGMRHSDATGHTEPSLHASTVPAILTATLEFAITIMPTLQRGGLSPMKVQPEPGFGPRQGGTRTSSQHAILLWASASVEVSGVLAYS